MADLDPPEGEVLTTTELVFTSESITAAGFDAPPDWSYTLTALRVADESYVEIGYNIDCIPSGMELVVSYFSDVFLFPIRSIEYLDPDLNVHSVKYWEDLPPVEQAPDVTALREDKKDFCEWELEVTASGVAAGMPATASGTYTIRVYANYTTSRDALVAAINKRYR